MNRYRKPNRLIALVLLVCFFTTLSGVSAGAGHDCCGNCAETAGPRPLHTESMLVANDCCPSGPTCTCTFESADARDFPAYALVQVSMTGDNLTTGLSQTVSPAIPAKDNRQTIVAFILSENQPRSGPIYLTNQSFLC